MASHRLVAAQEAHNFIKRCMMAVGTVESHASDLADLLVAADSRGHFSHGLNRLEMYVTDVQSGTTSKEGTPSIIKETPATALVDGGNVLGPVAGKFCMELAVKKAKESGVGWIACRGSNHYGIAGYYGLMASNQGMIGMSFTNTSPIQVPTRAKQAVLGTNPLCCAAPAKNGDSFVLDMATSAVAVGKVEICDRKGAPIPDGWLVDGDGKPTNSSAESKKGGLLPLGGLESTSGYKGYGLAMMVEVFCGILSGSLYGHTIRKWTPFTSDKTSPANLGQCFVALDVGAFADGFEERMSDLMDYCRGLSPIEGESEVLVAGDPERKQLAKVQQDGGITYHLSLIEAMDKLAKELKVDSLRTLPSS